MGGDIETIKERLDIVEIVGGQVKLEKAGVSYKGRCPFHNEKTPSFFVSPLRGSYYCFGCGAKGDIFTFVQETEGLSFKEALKELAEKAGVEIKNVRVSQDEKTEKEQILSVLEVAKEFFQARLSENLDALKYLESRGLSKETIKDWQLGYAKPEWRALYHDLLAKGFKPELLFKAGLIKPVAGSAKEPYDVFRDRIIFPLFNQSGEVVAFSGRALPKDLEPKYINTPETQLFVKSELLYGLDRGKNDIRKKNYAVLVEGQLDLLLSHQAGVANTVASSGTAFTERHLERLKKLSPRIILAFDGDVAGAKAAEKSSEMAIRLGLEVKIAKLPDGKDPADVIKNNPEEWKQILRDSKSAVEYFLREIVDNEADRRKALKKIEQRLLPLLALLTSSIERSHFVSLIARETGVKEEMIWDDLRRTSDLIRKNALFRPVGLTRSTPADVVRDVLPKQDLIKGRARPDEYQEVQALLKESPDDRDLKRHLEELEKLIQLDEFDQEIENLQLEVARGVESASVKMIELSRKRDELRRKLR